MRIGFILATAAVIAGVSQVSAEPSSPAPPAPSRVSNIAPPPPSLPATMRTEWLKASQVVTGKRVDLLVDGDRAAVVEWPASERYGEPHFIPLENISSVLGYLADRRYEFLWMPLTNWAGHDLAQFRERLRRQAEGLSRQTRQALPMNSAESVTSGRLTAYIRLTVIYMDIGEAKLAQSVLEQYLAATAPQGRNNQRTLNWVIAKARLATVLQSQGRVAESFPHYDDIQRLAGKSVHSINGAINHAAALAESGRHSQALQLIDLAWARFRKESDGQGLAGSERQFAWIRACALNGLGRTEESKAIYEPVRESGRVFDRDFIVEPKESIEWRAHWCMRSETNLKRFLLNELRSERPTPAVLALQPAYRSMTEDPALLAEMRTDPEISAALTLRMRELPAAMVPALNKYR